MQSKCVSCLISRAFQEVKLATPDLDLQLEAMREVVRILNTALNEGGRLEKIPAYIGTRRDQAIQQITGCPDPYLKLKQESNKAALSFYQPLAEYVKEPSQLKQRFRRACIAASLGNVIEYGVEGHSIPWNDMPTLIDQAETELVIDHIDTLRKLAQNAETTLYLADNAGEIVFDRLLIEILGELGTNVLVAVKSRPILNDALLMDAQVAGLTEIVEVVTTGGGAVGVLPPWCSNDFLNRFMLADLIIAKGMGHHETLPEFTLPAPTAHLLRTKCEPVAQSLNVAKNRNVVKVLVNHRGPLGPLSSQK